MTVDFGLLIGVGALFRKRNPKPRLIRMGAIWYCCTVHRRDPYGLLIDGPMGRGLTPRVAYDAWLREGQK